MLLSVRSGESWVRSMRETIWPMYFGDSVMRHVNAARAHVDDEWRRFLALMTHMCWDEQTGAMVGAEHRRRRRARRGSWTAGTTASARASRADRLLVWNPAEGWEPLCEFLEVPVPDGPVPNVNDTLAFREGVLGGGLAVLNAWWDQRERPAGGFHGADS